MGIFPQRHASYEPVTSVQSCQSPKEGHYAAHCTEVFDTKFQERRKGQNNHRDQEDMREKSNVIRMCGRKLGQVCHLRKWPWSQCNGQDPGPATKKMGLQEWVSCLRPWETQDWTMPILLKETISFHSVNSTPLVEPSSDNTNLGLPQT